MSIFDVIRYPISCPPKIEELGALPEDLFREWVDNHTLDWRLKDPAVKYNTENICNWMHSFIIDKRTAPEIISDIDNLREVILRWDK